MLPMPGASSSTLSLYRARLSALFEGADVRVCIAFWLFGRYHSKSVQHVIVPISYTYAGLINNVLYVIILSAALDLVGPTIPKSAVLLFDVIPSFLVKLTAPYYIHNVAYSWRVLIFVGLSTCGMLLIALTPSSIVDHGQNTPGMGEILFKMSGVVLASLSAGGGELSFLGLTHYYGSFSLASWGSGTGGAGLIGAGAYVLATTTIGLTVRTSLLAFSFLPIVMLLSFFIILPKEPMRLQKKGSYANIPDLDEEDPDDRADDESLLGQTIHHDNSPVFPSKTTKHGRSSAWQAVKAKMMRAQSLFFP